MTDDQSNDSTARGVTNEVIAPEVVKQVKQFDRTTRVAEGLQSTKALRDKARNGGNSRG